MAKKQIDTRAVPPEFWVHLHKKVINQQYGELTIKIHDYIICQDSFTEKEIPMVDENNGFVSIQSK